MGRGEKSPSSGHGLAESDARQGPPSESGVLTAELAEFCQSGVSVVLASVGSDGRPVVGRGLACRIDTKGRMRVILREPPNRLFLVALAAGGPVAATFTRPSTHRSIQLKAQSAAIALVEPPDGPAAHSQSGAFAAELAACGYDATFAYGHCGFEPYELCAIEFLPASAFVQTPGPAAGSVLAP